MTDLHERANVRQLAGEILLKVDRQKAYADILLDRALKTHDLCDRDRALLTELVYGTLRWRAKIDARLSGRLRRSLAETDPFVKNLLRLTVYQLFFLDRVPDYAAVNEAVELAKTHCSGKAAGFVNGVLRNLLRQKNNSAEPRSQDASARALAAEYSHPEWLVRRWVDEFGLGEATALMHANNQRAPLVLRVNQSECGRTELLAHLLANGITASATPWSPQGIFVESGGNVENLPGFAEGLFQIQGEASQLIGYLVSPVAGERILDACAAPGGKTTHLSELMDDRGQLIALDKSARGVEQIRENAKRMKSASILVARADVTKPLDRGLRAPYDRILVDAPCSGLGTLRSHPEIKWHRQEKDIRRLSELQWKILHRVADYLKEGGILVYSTCTLTHEENEAIVEAFLARHIGFELEDAARYLPESAKRLTRGNYFQALPHRDNTDGFFGARLRKVS